MKKTKSTWRYGWILGMLLLWLCGMQVFATGLSDDNSLADLGVENGTVSPEFYYSTVEYTVTVSPGTTSLVLNPVCSNANAQIVSIDGTTLDNGSGTVTITVRSESGNDAVYTLHVQPDPSAAQTETETETQATEAPATEKQTEAQTEAVQTEAQTEDSATITFLNGQISQFREKLDFSMKIIYGLIALAVVLMFLSINLLLKNRDLKDDLRDAEDHLDFQTNEFARKERMMDTDNYYAPTKQQPLADRRQPVQPVQPMEEDEEPEEEPVSRRAAKKAAKAAAKEEKAAKKEEKRQRKEEAPVPVRGPKAPVSEEAPQAPKESLQQPEEAPVQEEEKDDVDVTMVDL